MKKTISIFFPLFFALCTFCESANADVRIGLPRVTVPISPDIRVVPQPQYVEPTIVVPTIITDLLQDTTAVMADRTVVTMAAITADIIDNLMI